MVHADEVRGHDILCNDFDLSDIYKKTTEVYSNMCIGLPDLRENAVLNDGIKGNSDSIKVIDIIVEDVKKDVIEEEIFIVCEGVFFLKDIRDH